MANASLTISFNTTTSDSSNQFIDLELDDDKNEEENGTTSGFKFGSTVYFRMRTDCSNVSFYSTGNSVQSGGSGSAEVKETITFTEPISQKDNTASLSKLVSSGFSAESPLGGDAGSITVDIENDPKTAKASKAGVAVYAVTYMSNYTSHSIVGPSEPAGWDPEGDAFPIVIVAVGV